MKRDTRELGMAASVWVVAAIVVLALGRVETPAGLLAGHETEVAAAPLIEPSLPPLNGTRDLERSGQGKELAAAERASLVEPIPVARLFGDDERLGTEPRPVALSNDRGGGRDLTAPAASNHGEPTGGHDTATDSRAAAASPDPVPTAPLPGLQPRPVAPKPEPAEQDPKPRPAEANPRPAKAQQAQPRPAKAQPKPAEAKPRPAEPDPKPKPAEPKPRPAEPDPKPKPAEPHPKPKPGEPRPKPEPAKPESEQSKPDPLIDRADRSTSEG